MRKIIEINTNNLSHQLFVKEKTFFTRNNKITVSENYKKTMD